QTMGTEAAGERVTVEFRVDDERYPFVGASELESCTFELEEMIPRGDGVYSEFFRVRGADTDRILDVADATPQVDATLISADGDEAFFEFEVAGGCIAVSLAEAGAHPQVVRGEDGDGTVVADCPRERARPVVRDVLDDHGGVELVAEDAGEGVLPSVDDATFHETVHEVLTPRQRGAFLVAVSDGFYEWPRETTLADVAETLDTDPAVLDARLRNCEQLVLAGLFEDGALGDADGPTHPLSSTTDGAAD
ncbi:MAG: bacterio-opsin activator domain-containing protein, partial [Halobacterium sp.]